MQSPRNGAWPIRIAPETLPVIALSPVELRIHRFGGKANLKETFAGKLL
ncbi:hypothetical protein ACWEOZ_25495 [Actinoplanes sp. NPDC004185]